MPNTPSAKKRLRQSEQSRIRNRSSRSALRTQIRKVREAVAKGDFDTAQNEFRIATRRLDQAASKRLIHKNVADRTKSRLSQFIKKASQAPAA